MAVERLYRNRLVIKELEQTKESKTATLKVGWTWTNNITNNLRDKLAENAFFLNNTCSYSLVVDSARPVTVNPESRNGMCLIDPHKSGTGIEQWNSELPELIFF